MQNVLVFGDKRTTITASGCQHIAFMVSETMECAKAQEHSLHDCQILIVVYMMVSNDDANADGKVWRCNSQCKCCFYYDSCHIMLHDDFIGARANDVTICYLFWFAQCLHQLKNILSPCTKCVLDLCRIPREAKKTTRQMRWWLNPLPSSRWKSWITWLAQTPSCRRHGWQVGFEPPVLLWRLILVSKLYESSGSGTGSERISGWTREGNFLMPFYCSFTW